MDNMNKIDQLTIEEIDKQIDDRQKLIDSMVGSLYPSILRSEIEKLLNRKRELLSKDSAPH